MIDPDLAFARIVAQHALGPRYVGSDGHEKVRALLREWLAGADTLHEQRFVESFFGQEVECGNLWARYDGDRPGRILLGSHFDTRPWADRDPNPARRRQPVPGANDGASGVALLAELASELATRRQRPTIDIVFFDAEDWHDIDGHEVSLGARRFVESLAADDRPERAIIVDMIAGEDLMLDVEVTCQEHDGSYDLTLALFQLGRSLGLSCFELAKDHPYKWITCDHSPFLEAKIPSCVLIDIDYPEWHTTRDLPEHCSAASLAQVGKLLDEVIFGAGLAAAPLRRG